MKKKPNSNVDSQKFLVSKKEAEDFFRKSEIKDIKKYIHESVTDINFVIHVLLSIYNSELQKEYVSRDSVDTVIVNVQDLLLGKKKKENIKNTFLKARESKFEKNIFAQLKKGEEKNIAMTLWYIIYAIKSDFNRILKTLPNKRNVLNKTDTKELTNLLINISTEVVKLEKEPQQKKSLPLS